MLSIYSSFVCKTCKKEFVLLSEDVENLYGYLVCPYCSSKRVKKECLTDNLKECMQHASYKRVRGALRQR